MKKTFTMMLLSGFSFGLFAQDSEKLAETFANEIPGLSEQFKVPGVAVAVINNSKVVLKEGFGFADQSKEILVDPTHGFNIGSISKMFTAWGIMNLVEEGKLSLDEPVTTYLGRWTLPEIEFKPSDITIRSLLSHTAGLSVHGYAGYRSKEELPSLEGSLSGTKDADEKVEIIIEPNTEWKYSGGGYTVLQLVIEEVTGKSVADYMDEAVFEPLNMNNTSFNITKKIMKSSAKPYDEDGEEIELRRFAAQAAAGLHTNLEDFSLFALASLADNPVLTQPSLDQLIAPTELSGGNYGMGYMIMNRFGSFTLTGHGGSNDGWQAGYMLDLEGDSGIIILTNGSGGRNLIFSLIQKWAQWYQS